MKTETDNNEIWVGVFKPQYHTTNVVRLTISHPRCMAKATWLTPTEARRLAADLIEQANSCEVAQHG